MPESNVLLPRTYSRVPQCTRLAPYLLLAILVLAIMAPYTPAIRPIPSRDSGVFLYTGWRILAGEVPYRDVWDHKPPGIFFVDALGLLIGRGSVWGVCLLEFIAVCGAALVAWRLLERAYGVVPALFGSVAWLAGLALVSDGGNLPEEFALPAQLAALYAFWRAEERGRYAWEGYAIGLTCALAFLLKQNSVGVWLAMGGYLVVSRALSGHVSDLRRPLATMAAGASSVALAPAWFAARGALGAFWDVAFRYNLVYVRWRLETPLEIVGSGLQMLLPSGVPLVALAGWCVGVVYVLCRNRQPAGSKALLGVALIGLPIEFLLVGISSRSLTHYFMAWLPVFALLTGFVTWVLQATLVPWVERAWGVRGRALLVAGGAAILLAMAWLPAQYLLRKVASAPGERRDNLVAFIRETTAQDDWVLMWGAETGYNFLTRRRSPTRYVYQYPLYMPGYESPARVQEFLRDIMAKKPALIVDTSPGNGRVFPIDATEREKRVPRIRSYVLLPEMDEVFAYIHAHYRRVVSDKPDPWSVYYVYVGDVGT